MQINHSLMSLFGHEKVRHEDPHKNGVFKNEEAFPSGNSNLRSHSFTLWLKSVPHLLKTIIERIVTLVCDLFSSIHQFFVSFFIRGKKLELEQKDTVETETEGSVEIVKKGLRRFAQRHRRQFSIKDISFNPTDVKATLTEYMNLATKTFVEKISSQPEVNKISEKKATDKMQANLTKALKEHGKIDLLSKINFSSQSSTPLNFDPAHFSTDNKLYREKMEDSYLISTIDEGYLYGVFDGHGDNGDISSYIAKNFSEYFSKQLKKHSHDIKHAFNETINHIHERVIKAQIGPEGGSTACICFVDKKTNIAYIATLGDTEAKIFREIEGSIVALTASCVRSFSSQKDAERASKALKKASIATEWPTKNAKDLRFPNKNFGVNVSRAIGDECFNTWNGVPVVIQKPKISMIPLEKNDRIVIACDGVWDYTEDQELITNVLTPYWNRNSKDLAYEIVKYALIEGNSMDNITAIAVTVN